MEGVRALMPDVGAFRAARPTTFNAVFGQGWSRLLGLLHSALLLWRPFFLHGELPQLPSTVHVEPRPWHGKLTEHLPLPSGDPASVGHGA